MAEDKPSLTPTEPEKIVTEALAKAEELYADDKILQAARTITSANIDRSNPNIKPIHLTILYKAAIGENITAKLKSSVQDTASANNGDNNDDEDSTNVTENKWIKQGKFKTPSSITPPSSTLLYYKLEPNVEDSTKSKYLIRIETPIDPTFLKPFLSVLNETQLFTSFLPNWSTPIRLRIDRVERLQQTGRASQVVLISTEVPWPMPKREIVLRATAWDDIDERGDIGIHLRGMGIADDSEEEEDFSVGMEDDLVIPEVEKGSVRVPWEGGILIRKCPLDHPVLVEERNIEEGEDSDAVNTENDDSDSKNDKILISFTIILTPRLTYVPQFLLNFVFRVVVKTIWNMFLQVAQDVKDGKRPAHAEAIEEKRESLYDWVDERVSSMVSSMSSVGVVSEDLLKDAF